MVIPIQPGGLKGAVGAPLHAMMMWTSGKAGAGPGCRLNCLQCIDGVAHRNKVVRWTLVAIVYCTTYRQALALALQMKRCPDFLHLIFLFLAIFHTDHATPWLVLTL